MSLPAAERAFAADPNPASARALLLALGREREAASRLLPLIDGPERDFEALCWEAEALPNDSLRPASWEAIAALIASWPDALRALAPRHLIDLELAAQSPLFRRLEPAGPPQPIPRAALAERLRGHPIRELELAEDRLPEALPAELRALTLAPTELAALARLELPGLRDLRVRDFHGSPSTVGRGLDAPWAAQLEHLSLPVRSPGPPELAIAARRWPALRSLAFRDGLGGPARLGELAPELRALSTRRHRLGSLLDRLPDLLEHPLERLHVAFSEVGDASKAADIAPLLTSMRLPAHQLPELPSAFPRLRALDLVGIWSPPPAAVTALLASCPRLDALSLRDIPTGILAAVGATGPWPVRSLTVRARNSASDLRWLEAFPELEELRLHARPIATLFDILEARPELELSCRALLTEADLERSPSPRLSLDLELPAALLPALARSPLRRAVRSLSLMGDGTAALIAEALEADFPRVEELRARALPTALWFCSRWPRLRRAGG